MESVIWVGLNNVDGVDMPVPGHNATAVVTHAAEDGLTGEFLVGQLVSLESFQCSSNSCDVGVEIRL